MSVSDDILVKRLRRYADNYAQPSEASERIRHLMRVAADRISSLERELATRGLESYTAGAAPIAGLTERIADLDDECTQLARDRERARGLAARLWDELERAEEVEGILIGDATRDALIAAAALVDRELVYPSSQTPFQHVSLRLHTASASADAAAGFVADMRRPAARPEVAK